MTSDNGHGLPAPSSDNIRISVVIPAYNEASSLAEGISRVRNVVAPLGSYEIIIVDDGSSDNTWQATLSLCREWQQVQGLRLSRNFGKEAAMIAGILHAKGDAIVVMDADMQHPPELVPKMVGLWAGQDADIVNAVKVTREREARTKLFATNGFFRLFSWMSGMNVANASDFKLLDRRVADVLRDMPERHQFFRGLVAWVGFKQVEVPFEVEPRAEGKSTFSAWKRAILAINAIVSFSTLPMHLMTLIGSLFAIVAIGLTVQTVRLWVKGEAAVGFSSVILLLVIIGSALMIGLGIIGVYIAKIYEEVKGRPRFLIRERYRHSTAPEPEADTGRTRRSAREADLLR